MGFHLPEKKGGKRSQSTGKRILSPRVKLALLIAAAVLMVLLAAVCVMYFRMVRKPVLPSAKPAASHSLSPEGEEGELGGRPDVQSKVSGTRKSEDYFTILVFGSDESSGLTDTMMLVSYDVTNQKATVMSIPRDTLSNVNAKSLVSRKMNAIYKVYGGGEEGVEALRTEVSELVGFWPDYYIMIDWELVGQMVDAIGGVWFDVPRQMDYDDPTQDLHIHQQAGYRLLSGDDAMQVVRWRKNNDGSGGANGDIGRLEIQHDFLSAVLDQTLQLKNVTKINELSKLFGDNVESDLSFENLLWFATQAIMGGLKTEDVEFTTMPFEYGYYGGVSFVYPDEDELIAMINQSLNPFEQEVTIDQLDLMSVGADGSLRSSSGRVAGSAASSGTSGSSSGGSASAAPVPTLTPAPAATKTPAPAATPAPTPAPSAPAASDRPAATPAPTPAPTPEPTPAPTAAPEPTATPTPAPEPTPAPTAAPQPEPTPEVTAAPAPTPEPPQEGTGDGAQPPADSGGEDGQSDGG